MSIKNKLIVKPIEKACARQFIQKYHYLGGKPFRSTKVYGLFMRGRLAGVIAFHSPSAPETCVSAFGLSRTDQGGIFEIGRLALVPLLNGGNAGSFFIAAAIKLLKKETKARAIITYADSTLHGGGIYRAANFGYYGLTAPKKDFYVNGKIQERGKTKGVDGVWLPRPRKHRFVMIFDKNLSVKWGKV